MLQLMTCLSWIAGSREPDKGQLLSLARACMHPTRTDASSMCACHMRGCMCKHARACTHTRTCTCTQTHVRTRACTLTCAYTSTHSCTHVNTWVCTFMCMHACMHVRTCAHMHLHTHACTHMYTRLRVHVSVQKATELSDPRLPLFWNPTRTPITQNTIEGGPRIQLMALQPTGVWCGMLHCAMRGILQAMYCATWHAIRSDARCTRCGHTV